MILSFFLIITGLLGFLTTSLLITKYKSNRIINVYLIFIFILLSIRFLAHGLLYFISNEKLNDSVLKYNGFFIILIPCLYLYFQKLTLNQTSFSKQDLKHLIIPVLFFVMLTKLNSSEVLQPQIWKFASITLFFIYVCTYFYMGYSILKKDVIIKSAAFRTLTKQNKLIKKWTFFLLVSATISVLRVLIALYLKIFFARVASDQSFIWISAIVWIVIFLKILLSPEILYGFDVLNEIIKKDKIYYLHFNFWDLHPNTVSNNAQHTKLKELVEINIVDYFHKIEKQSLETKVFKSIKFTISDFAQKLNIPTSHLNYLFKYHSKISFSDYKKSIRIHHSIQLIESGYLEVNTLDSLAKEVGYATYNTFFTSFKSVVGRSPREYIEQLRE